MDALSLARWQFGVTAAYHFLFVPLTIGLVFLVAVMQTLYHRSGREEYLRMTKFFGKLFLINFAMGVATGIVMEFQFGMNWSAYSRFVGDIFGAPLAIEGLLAFFMESTFLGLWIFGWGRLGPKIHLTTIWLVTLGTNLSAIFILGANAWMQHPVGYHINPTTGRAEMTDFFALVTNPTLLVTYPHVAATALLTGALFVLGVSAYHLLRQNEVAVFQRAAAIGLVFGIIASLGVVFTGDQQARMMTQQQPMKMAAAEATYNTHTAAGFSLFAIGTPDGSRLLLNVQIPHLLSVLATNTWNGQVDGINDVQASEAAQYGPGDYTPVIPVTYWTFRIMSYLAFVLLVFTAWGTYLVWRGRIASAQLFNRLAIPAIGLPFLAITAGWLFTEMGRQPWAVYGLLTTATSVSPAVPAWEVGVTLAGFTLIYAVLAVAGGWLLVRYARLGPVEEAPEAEPAPIFAY